MSSLNIDSDQFSINPQYRFQWEEAQQCHVLLFPEGLVKLSGSAAEIMQRCQQPTTLVALVVELQQTFPGVEGLENDVREFLNDAREQEWIVSV
jgi:pyrroloquinoline quinone biosynthesis protein D